MKNKWDESWERIKDNCRGCVSTQRDESEAVRTGMEDGCAGHWALSGRASLEKWPLEERDGHEPSQNDGVITASPGDSATFPKASGLVVYKGQESKLQNDILYIC